MKQETVQVTKEFVRQAHKAACQEWKKKIEEEVPTMFEKRYEVGTTIRILGWGGGEKYLLAKMGNKAYLFSKETGNVWDSEPMEVSYDRKVTKEDLDKYVGKLNWEETES